MPMICKRVYPLAACFISICCITACQPIAGEPYNAYATSIGMKEIVDNPTERKGDTPVSANSQEKHDILYLNILKAIENMEVYIDTSEFDIQPGWVYRIIDQILDEHPEVFYLDSSNIKYNNSGVLELQYNYSKADILKMISQLDEVLREFEAQINSKSLTEIEKEAFVHDFLIKSAEYGIDNDWPEMSHNAYGVLVNRKGVCNGFAKAAMLLLNEIGISSSIVYGEANNTFHAWNRVEIEGKIYNTDITWDELESTEQTLSYCYFNKSNQEFSKDHFWNQDK